MIIKNLCFSSVLITEDIDSLSQEDAISFILRRVLKSAGLFKNKCSNSVKNSRILHVT